MRHRLGHRKLNKPLSHRMCMLRGMATQLIQNGFIVTTIEKAKELRKIVEPLVNLAKQDDFNSRRKAASLLYTKAALNKLFLEVGPKNLVRNGGYTRILKLGFRPGDNAKRVAIELVEFSKLVACVENNAIPLVNQTH